jgi:hypothetical protein
MAKKKKWKKTKVQLPADHGWQAAPGNKVFVADAGAMQFEVPGSWTIKPGENGSIRFFDRKKEADADIRLEVSLIYAPNIDWSGLPLPQLVEDAALSGDPRGLTGRGPFHHFRRATLEGVWLEVDFIDDTENRPAHSRICMARGPGAYALITMDFWVDDSERARPVWEAAIETLKLDGTSRDRLNIDGSHRPRKLSLN